MCLLLANWLLSSWRRRTWRRWMSVDYQVCVWKSAWRFCRLVKAENQVVFYWMSLGWEGKGFCSLLERCGLCFLERAWLSTSELILALKKKVIIRHCISLQDKVWSVTQSDDSANSLYFPSFLLPRNKYRLFRQEEKKNLTTIPIVCLMSQNVSISLQCCR